MRIDRQALSGADIIVDYQIEVVDQRRQAARRSMACA
jgi:hypothetical protein